VEDFTISTKSEVRGSWKLEAEAEAEAAGYFAFSFLTMTT
jgi:hypothetical protein